jgi:sugar phosphate isomerase/epimerase
MSRSPFRRRALSTLGCPDLSFEETLVLAERHGLTGVELRFLGGTSDIPAYLKQHYGTPQALRDRLQASPVAVIGFGTSFKLPQNTPADREALLAFVPWAEALGGASLRVFDGDATLGTPALAETEDTWKWWQERRRGEGWQTNLMIETHDVFLESTSLRRLVDRLPDCRILWDTHHTWRRGGEDPAATWQALRTHIVHIHVKDSVNRPSARHPYTYVLPGEGEFPLKALAEALSRDGYGGFVSLEWEKKWLPELPSLEVALETAARSNWW